MFEDSTLRTMHSKMFPRTNPTNYNPLQHVRSPPPFLLLTPFSPQEKRQIISPRRRRFINSPPVMATLRAKFNKRGMQGDSFGGDFGCGDAEYCGCADFVGCERGGMVCGDCFGVCEGFEVGFLRGGEE